MQYTLIGTINDAVGATFIWRVIQANNTCAYEAGDTITPNEPGPAIVVDNPQTTTITIAVDPLLCSELIIALIVVVDGEECVEEYYSLSDNPGDYTHYECVPSDISECLLVLGPHDPLSDNSFLTYEECLACQSCGCNVDNPCNTVDFSAAYVCTPSLDDTNTIQICMTQNEDQEPITITSIVANINNNPVQLLPEEIILTQVGECVTFSPLQVLPNGIYYITLYVSTVTCPLLPIAMLVNCGGVNPPPSTTGVCCETNSPTEADQGNLGGFNCKVIDLSSLPNNSQDLILDFGMNLVADKIEVFAGVIDCSVMDDTPNVAEPFLIASTPYVGEPTLCLNQPGCFKPAQPSDTDPIQTGFKIFEGVWDLGTNNGTVVSTIDIGTLVPPYSFDNTCSTPGGDYCGGPVPGQGRLIIPAGTYTNTYITIVVHNSGAEEDGVDCCPNQVNNTAWRYFLICPGCVQCGLEFKNINYYCDPSVPSYGGIVFGIETLTYIPTEPIRVVIKPTNGSAIDALTNSFAKVTDFITPYYYQMTPYDYDNDGFNDSVMFDITDVLDWSTYTVYIGFTADDGSDVAIDVLDGGYELHMFDAVNCDAHGGINVDCGCTATIDGITGNTEYCTQDPDVYLEIDTTGFLCSVWNFSTITGLPAWLTSSPLGQDKIIISGTYPGGSSTPLVIPIHVEIDCNSCFDEYDFNITINSYKCRMGTSVVNTTCGLSNGEITVTSTDAAIACTATYPIDWEWEDGTSGTDASAPFSITRSGLAAGTYTLTLTDANGCSLILPVTVDDDGAVVADAVADITIPCPDTSVPSVDITNIAGGTAPYDINIYVLGTIPPFFSDTGVAAGNYSAVAAFVAGNYTIEIIDAAGCIYNDNFIITADILPSLTVQSLAGTSCGLSNGNVTFTLPSGAVLGVSHNLYYGIGITDCSDVTATQASAATVTGLTAGTYKACIEDIATGCCKCITFIIPNAGTVPSAPVVGNDTICVGETAQLTATCLFGSVPTWYNSGSSTVLYTGSPLSVSPTTTTSYDCKCVTTSIPKCKSSITTATATVNALPTMTTPTSVVVCSGGNTAIVPSGCSGTVTWKLSNTTLQVGSSVGGGTVTSLSPNLVIAGVTSSVIITAICTNGSGCVNQTTTGIIVNPKPTVTTTPISACQGTQVSLATAITSVNSQVGIPSGYTVTYWSGANCTGSSISPLVTATSGTTLYYANVLNNSTGCSRCVALSVVGSASINPTIVGPTVMCVGNTMTLTASPTGGTYTYQWKKNGVNISGATSSSYTITPIALSDAGTYTVVVTNGVCTGTSPSHIVTVSSGAPLSISNVTVCQSAGFGSISGITPANITWTSDNYNILPAGSSTIGQITYNKNYPGVANVTVTTTSASCPSSTTFTITINAAPPITTISNACQSGLFSDYITNFDDVTYDYSYKLNTGIGPFPCPPTSSTPLDVTTVIPSSGVYTIQVSDGTCVKCGTITVGSTPQVISALPHTCEAGCDPGYATVDIILNTPIYNEDYITVTNSLLGLVWNDTGTIPGSSYFVTTCLPTGDYTIEVGSSAPTGYCTSTYEFSVSCCATCQNPNYQSIVKAAFIDTTGATGATLPTGKTDTTVDTGTVTTYIYNSAGTTLLATVTDSAPFAVSGAHGLGAVAVKTITEWNDGTTLRSRVYQSFTLGTPTGSVTTVPDVTNATIQLCALKELAVEQCGIYYLGIPSSITDAQDICDLTPPITIPYNLQLPADQMFTVNFISNYPDCACGVEIPNTMIDFQNETLFESIFIYCQS